MKIKEGRNEAHHHTHSVPFIKQIIMKSIYDLYPAVDDKVIITAALTHITLSVDELNSN